ncbi:MAG: hypothetical protein J0H06_14795 [Actinobacteria bacterium]|nr:hypothetical protein [Actinomycetota bacterium]
MAGKVADRSPILQWVIVLGVGLLVAAVVLSLQLIPRLDAGQKVLDGAKPAFTTPRIGADVAGINFISKDVNMADPLMTPTSGASEEVPAVIAYVAETEHISEAEAVALVQKTFPHTFGLLEALPLSATAEELPALEEFLEEALGVTPEQLTAALKENFPAITQAITNLPKVTEGWEDIPGIEGLTRFDGTPVKTVPQLRDYFKDDLIPAVGAQQSNFESLDGTSQVNWIAPVLLIIAGIVVLFAAAMIARNLWGSPSRGERIAAASVVPVVGVIVVGLVLALALIPRVNHGQKLLDGLEPAFAAQRVEGDRTGIDMVSTIVNTEDPIMTPQGGAAAEVPKLIAFVAEGTGLSEAEVVAALQKNFPHVLGLLQALPLSAVSAELPEVEEFLKPALGAVPALAQTIENAPAVTGGWNEVPDMNGATNFAGTPIKTAPDVRDYFSQDVVPVLENQQGNYEELTGISTIGFIGWLVLAVGIIVIAYGVLMIVLAAGWLQRGGAARPSIASQTRDGVQGMSM